MNTYQDGKVYAAGELVFYNHKLYQKAADGDNSPPDDVPGGWAEVHGYSVSNAEQFEKVTASLNSYEQRVIEHQEQLAKAKQSAEAKLAALGLTAEEIAALAA